MEGIYKERVKLKTEMRHRGTVFVASEDLFLCMDLPWFSIA